jgi:hypothetical protein
MLSLFCLLFGKNTEISNIIFTLKKPPELLNHPVYVDGVCALHKKLLIMKRYHMIKFSTDHQK